MVSYTRNKIDFFNPKLNRKVFYRWSGNKMTVLLLIHLWLTLSSYDRYGLNVLCRFSLYDDITKRPKELCLLGSIHKATPRGFLQKRAHLILHYSYFPLCHAKKNLHNTIPLQKNSFKPYYYHSILHNRL